MTDNAELRATLAQLCADLLAPDVSRADQRDVLRSLASLVEQFPVSQKTLGRLLSDQQPLDLGASEKAGPATPARAFRPLLAELASRCLYDRETSHSAIALLAVLSHNNVINQRRVVRWVPGARLPTGSFAGGCDPQTAKRCKGSDLFVLSVPAAVKATYRKWRKRQRAVHTPGRGGRVPTGMPPVKDGVPTPCYCDGCLGAEQLLATWCRHFSDLTRWTADPNGTPSDDTAGGSDAQERPVLSAPDFFRAELTGYELRSCRCVPEPVAEAEQLGDDQRGRVYYFVPREAGAMRAEFDPAHHVSAILITSDVFDAVEQTRQPSCPSVQEASSAGKTEVGQRGGGRSVDEGEEEVVDPLDGLDEVILLDDRLTTTTCDRKAKPQPLVEATLTGEGLIATLCLDQQSILRADLLAKLDGRDSLKESDAVVLRLVLAFFADAEQLSVAALDEVFGRLGSPRAEEAAAETVTGVSISEAIDAQVIVRACLSARMLRIEFAIDADVKVLDEASARAVYAADLLLIDVAAEFALPDTSTALIALSDEDLRTILSRCRVCRCGDRHEDDRADGAGGWTICLRFSRVASREQPTIEHQPTEAATIPSHNNTKTSSDKLSGPLPGLPDTAEVVLTRILAAIEDDGVSLDGPEALSSLVQQLSAAISSCNARVRELSSSRSGATTHARLAATNRCRACRDGLLELCKQLKLTDEEQSGRPTSAGVGGHGLLAVRRRQLRLRRNICTGLRSVLAASDHVDAWETPDKRVDELRLDRGAWASGVPDFEFFQERDARAAGNSRRQRELSRRLQAQHQRVGGG